MLSKSSMSGSSSSFAELKRQRRVVREECDEVAETKFRCYRQSMSLARSHVGGFGLGVEGSSEPRRGLQGSEICLTTPGA